MSAKVKIGIFTERDIVAVEMTGGSNGSSYRRFATFNLDEAARILLGHAERSGPDPAPGRANKRGRPRIVKPNAVHEREASRFKERMP